MAFNLTLFEADFSVDEYTANLEAEFLHPYQFDWEEGDNDFDLLDEWENNNTVVEHNGKHALLMNLIMYLATSTKQTVTKNFSVSQ